MFLLSIAPLMKVNVIYWHVFRRYLDLLNVYDAKHSHGKHLRAMKNAQYYIS